MAYTDFPNVAAPEFWNSALSGRAERSDSIAAPGGDYPLIDTLDSIWDGEKYIDTVGVDFFGDSFPALHARFAPSEPVLATTVYLESAASYYDSPAILAYGVDGQLIGYDNPSIGDAWTGHTATATQVADLGPFGGEWDGLFRLVWQFDFPSPTLITRLEFFGYEGYSQGRPRVIWGIYGLDLGDPLPPTQFWSGLRKSEQEPL